MAEKTEVTIGAFGRMMFEVMLNEKPQQMADHWKSIAAEAKPLVEQLLVLNDKMQGGGYYITGRKVNGKKQKPKHQRIREAQERTWGCFAGDLKEGDLIWVNDGDEYDMYVGQDDPLVVTEVTGKGVYVEVPHMGGEHTSRINKGDKVIKAPDEWIAAHNAAHEAASRFHQNIELHKEYQALRALADEKEKELTSEAYWLQKADELGI